MTIHDELIKATLEANLITLKTERAAIQDVFADQAMERRHVLDVQIPLLEDEIGKLR